jgi:O-antigen/teichoic acid export membrane protein
MALANLLFKNTFFSFVSFGLRFFFNTIVIFVIARSIGVENFGIFTFSQSFTGIFSILTDIGISIYITREIAGGNKSITNNFTNIIIVKIFLSLATFIVIYSTIYIAGYEKVTNLTILYITIAVIFDNFINIFKGLYRGFEKFEYEAIITGLNSFILFVLILAIIYLKAEVVLIAKTYAISRLITLGLTFLLSKNIPDLYANKRYNFNFIKNLLKESFPYGIHILFGIIYFQIDTVMLEAMRGNYEVGIYQAGIKIVVIGLFFSAIFQNSFLPTLSRLFGESSEKMIQVAVKMNKYLLTLGFALSIVIFIYSKSIIQIVYGDEFLVAENVVNFLSLLIIIRFSATAYGVILTASGKQKWKMYSTISATIFNVVLNYFLIAKFGYMGAVIATILTNILIFILYLILSYKITANFLINKDILKIILISVILFIMGICLKEQSFYFSAPLLTLCFITLTYFLILEGDEKNLIQKFLKKTVKV